MNKPLASFSLASGQARHSSKLEEMREELLGIIKRESFKETAEPSFKLASGIVSRYYVDCKMTLAIARARMLTAQIMFDMLLRDGELPHAVGGLIVGAIPISIALSDAAYNAGKDIRFFFVRKDPKGHGLGKFIEGLSPQPGLRVVVVDDVVTSGGSTITAIERCKEVGLDVKKVIVMVDRQESDGRQNIEKQGVAFEALFTISDLRKK